MPEAASQVGEGIDAYYSVRTDRVLPDKTASSIYPSQESWDNPYLFAFNILVIDIIVPPFVYSPPLSFEKRYGVLPLPPHLQQPCLLPSRRHEALPFGCLVSLTDSLSLSFIKFVPFNFRCLFISLSTEVITTPPSSFSIISFLSPSAHSLIRSCCVLRRFQSSTSSSELTFSC